MIQATSIVVTAGYSLACLGAGSLAWRLARSGNDKEGVDDYPALTATLFLAGICIYYAVWTVVGLLGHLRPLPVVVLLLPGLAGLWVGRLRWVTGLLRFRSAILSWRSQPVWFYVLVCVTGAVVLGFGVAAWIEPPSGDAEAFYLVYPKVMAASGWLEAMPGPYYAFSVIGIPLEMHYTALMALAGPMAAKLIVWPIALSSGALLAAITKECGGGRVSCTLSWTVLFSSTTFSAYIYDGKVDLLSAALGLSAIYWLVVSKSHAQIRGGVMASGLLAGFATVAKFSYLPALGAALAVLLVWRHHSLPDVTVGSHPRRRSIGQLTGSVVLMAAMFALAWVPQMAKNSVLFNAPLAPFIGYSHGASILNQVWFSSEVTRRILVTYPLTLVFGQYPMQGGGLSPLLLAFAPFLWIYRSVFHNKLLVAVTISGLVAVVSWMVFRPSVIAPRYILAPLLLLVPVVSIATEMAIVRPNHARLLQWGVVLACVVVLIRSSWILKGVPGAILADVRGLNENGCWLASPYCSQMESLSKTVPVSERMFIAGYYAYWLRPDQLQCRDSEDESKEVLTRSDPVPWLRKNGFRYVVVDQSAYPQLADTMKYLAQTDESIRFKSGSSLLNVYELAADKSLLSCTETSPGRWEVTPTRYQSSATAIAPRNP